MVDDFVEVDYLSELMSIANDWTDTTAPPFTNPVNNLPRIDFSTSYDWTLDRDYKINNIL